MEKMITIFAEVAVATVVLFGLVALTQALMDNSGTTPGAIYSGLNDLINTIFDAAKNAALQGMQ